jgi:hypothetical protein
MTFSFTMIENIHNFQSIYTEFIGFIMIVLENVIFIGNYHLPYAMPPHGAAEKRRAASGHGVAWPGVAWHSPLLAGGYPPSRPQGLARPRRLPAAKTQTGLHQARTRFEQFLFFCNKTIRTRLVTSY